MPKFKISAIQPDTGIVSTMYYDSTKSTLTDGSGVSLVKPQPLEVKREIPAVMPLGKTGIKTLKIQLGLSCNYECEYCSQRFVPHAGETNSGDVAPFIDGLDSWVSEAPERIEFWGGEPLVYIKTLRPLADALRVKYPNALFSIITNGSLLTREINLWLDELGFSVGLSHDGPGQYVRGPDPLENEETRDAILHLYGILSPKKRMSFNAMMNKNNVSRSAVQKFFVELTGDENVPIGEGGIVDAYDDGGKANSLTPSDFLRYRNLTFHDIRTGSAKNFEGVTQKIMSFVNSIRLARPIEAIGQKCSMDRPDNVAVDLRGNVLTCQNVSAVSTAPNGKSHKIGHVSDLASVELKTSTHWTQRADCPKCPVIHLCAGACMFLDGPLWDASCDNAYSDNIVHFAAGIEFLTGLVPIYIDGDMREDRKDIFGMVNGSKQSAAQKPFPIPVVAG
jgi:uncharacterized protein